MKKALLTMTLAAALICSQGSFVFAGGQEAAGSSGAPGSASVEELLKGRDYAEGELLVTYDGSMSERKIDKNCQKKDADVQQIIENGNDEKTAQVSLSDGESVRKAILKFRQDSQVVDVQPNYRYHIAEDEADPFLLVASSKRQYHLSMVHAEEAWDLLESSGKKITPARVAVLDTGVDADHEDLQANLIEGNGRGNYTAFALDEQSEKTEDTGEHGTHIAGIIGATYGNGKGGSGVASGHDNQLVQVMSVGCSADGENIFTADVVKGINYAASSGADVINMSFGSVGRDRVEERAVIDAYNKGVVLVAASGNDHSNQIENPGYMKEVIAVNGTTSAGALAGWSNYGMVTDISAPGNSILSTMPGSRYGTMSGTSMAAPVVAGVAALVLDANPNLTPAQVYNIICASEGGKFDSKKLAYGIVDAEKCVRNALNAKTGPAESIMLKETSAEIYAGEEYTPEVLTLPADSLSSVYWSSSDTSVASVDQNGIVKGYKEGQAIITVQSGNRSAQCTVSVKPSVKTESVKILMSPADGELGIGEADLMLAQPLPSDAADKEAYYNKEIYWKSEDTSVAFVNEAGIIVGKKEGKTKITAYTYETPSDLYNTNSSSIKYIESEPVEITVKKAPSKVKMTQSVKWLTAGESFAFGAAVCDASGSSENVAHSRITWSVSKPSLAEIDRDSGMLKTFRSGTVTVTAAIPSDLALSSPYNWKVSRKVIIAKKDYKGKKDYRLRVTKKTKKLVRLTWKKNPAASGYTVQWKPSKGAAYSDYKTVKSSTRRLTVRLHKKGYYRVRANYIKNGEAGHYSWSNTVRVK